MKLELYKFDTCPYCIKVMDYIASTGRQDILYLDTQEDPANKETLIRTGGKYQVPCLFIDGEPMYESDDIIEWLKEHPQNGKPLF